MDTRQPLVVCCGLPEVHAPWALAGELNDISYEEYFHRQLPNTTVLDINQMARTLGICWSSS